MVLYVVKLQEESFAAKLLDPGRTHDEAKLEDVFRKNSAALEQLQQKLGSSHQEGHFCTVADVNLLHLIEVFRS